ncbi:MAG: hypothetical protein KTR24_06670, partial [Saprospiraceae bacterium]|nr:hypothetical protein [Saprospiraceae bacterium]
AYTTSNRYNGRFFFMRPIPLVEWIDKVMILTSAPLHTESAGDAVPSDGQLPEAAQRRRLSSLKPAAIG